MLRFVYLYKTVSVGSRFYENEGVLGEGAVGGNAGVGTSQFGQSDFWRLEFGFGRGKTSAWS